MNSKHAELEGKAFTLNTEPQTELTEFKKIKKQAVKLAFLLRTMPSYLTRRRLNANGASSNDSHDKLPPEEPSFSGSTGA